MNKTISGALLKEVAGLADAVYDDDVIRGKLFEKFGFTVENVVRTVKELQ